MIRPIVKQDRQTHGSKPDSIFYGWLVTLAAALLTAVGLGLFYSTNSMFVKPVCEELGLTRAQYTAHRSIVTLLGAALMPFYGNWIKRVGCRRVLLIGAVGMSLCMIGYSLATQLWQIYAVAFMNGLFLNGVSFMSVGILVSVWFIGKRGLATGIAYCGSGLGAAVAVPLVGAAIEAFGWRNAYRLMAAAGMLLAVPVIVFLVKDSPAKMGLQPYPDRSVRASETENSGVMLADAKKSPVFWLLLLALFGLSGCVAGPNTHTVPYLTDIGYTTQFATAIVSVFMLTLSAGKILLGSIYDRFGILAGNLFVSICCVGFPILAIASRVPAAAWGYAVFVGLASSSSSVPLSVLIHKYFGNRDFTAIFSLCNMAATLGTAVMVPIMGWIYDCTGSYTYAWLMLLGLALVSSVLLLITHRVSAAQGKRAGIGRHGET